MKRSIRRTAFRGHQEGDGALRGGGSGGRLWKAAPLARRKESEQVAPSDAPRSDPEVGDGRARRAGAGRGNRSQGPKGG